MISDSISRRYAQALFDVANSHGMVDAVEEGLNRAIDALTDDAKVWLFWTSRSLQPEEKHKVIDCAFTSEIMPWPVINYLKVVVDKGREAHLSQMRDVYKRLADYSRNVVNVELETAVPLPEQSLERIKNGLETSIKQGVRLRIHVNPSLIGGIMVRIGDKEIDGSLRSRLGTLKRLLGTDSLLGEC